VDDATTPAPAPAPEARLRLWPWLLALALLGFAFRLYYARHTAAATTLGDDDWYHVMGNQIAHALTFDKPYIHLPGGFGYITDGSNPPTAWHPPLFPMALALASKLGFSSFQNHQDVGCLIGAGSVVLTGLLARSVADALGHTPRIAERAGIAAAAATALYPPLVAWDSLLLSESLYVPLVVATLLATRRAVRAPSVRALALAGALAALSTLARAEGVTLIAVLMVVIALVVPGGWRARLRRALVFAAAAALVLGPWVGRNLVTFDKPVFLSTGFPPVALGANCHSTYYGESAGFWDFGCVAREPLASTLTEAIGPRTPDEGKLTSPWLTTGLDYATNHLGRVPAVVAIRVLRTWQLYKPSRALDYNVQLHGHWKRLEIWATRSYALVALFALCGLVLLTRRRAWRELAVLLAAPVAVTITSAIAFGETRFRVGAEPSLIVLATIAAVAAAQALGRRGSFSARNGRSTT
jgi:hypothetical protein